MMMSGSARSGEALVPIALRCIVRKALARFPPAIKQAHETQIRSGAVHQISKQTTRKRTTRQKDERTARAIPDFACHNNNNFLTSTVGLPLKSFLFTIVLFFYFLFYRPRRFGFHTCRLHRIPPLIALFSKQLFPFYHFVIYLV
jgi:hypothetical protein